MKSLTLEELKDTINTISPVLCDVLAEYCIVALEKNHHRSGCKLMIWGDENTELVTHWRKDVNVNGYQNQDELTERGAIAIALYLAAQLKNHIIVQQAEKGTGIDFWLGYDEAHELFDPDHFIHARLEIAGIFRENKNNTVEKKIAEKKKQTEMSDHTGFPVYISIIEFSSPKAFFGIK